MIDINDDLPTDWNLVRGGNIADALDHLAAMLRPLGRPMPTSSTCTAVEVALRDIAARIRGVARLPDGHPVLTRPRIDYGTSALTHMIRAGSAMQSFHLGPRPPYEPSEAELRAWQTVVECVLKADAEYRHRHPGEIGC